MPTMTRADSTEVYEHITKTLLGLEPTSPIMLALDAENLNTTMGILTLQVTDIPNLRFSRPKSKAEDPDEPPKHLSIGDKNHLRLFILLGRKLYRENKTSPWTRTHGSHSIRALSMSFVCREKPISNHLLHRCHRVHRHL